MYLGEPDFPMGTGVLGGGEGTGAGAAFVAGDGDVFGMGLGETGGDGVDADFGDEFDADVGAGVDVFQIMDELGQILDGVDVVVGRRGDEPDAGGGVTDLGDPLVDFVTGELAAFAGLGALGHLDLDGVGVDEVFDGDAMLTVFIVFDVRLYKGGELLTQRKPRSLLR